MPITFSPKKISETVTLTFNFSDQLLFLEGISTPVVTVDALIGTDALASSILSGVPTITGNVLSQKVTGGASGVTYVITAKVNGNSGRVYTLVGYLGVLSDITSYTMSALPSLSGILPSGIVGAAYSAPLTISGGYQPYFPNGVASGTFPTWMGFTVVGAQLICAGVPNEATGPTIYNFAPRINDAALNNASSPQVLTITRTTLAGDLPNGFIGQAVSYSYTISGGTAPYGPVTVIAGATPTGVPLGSDGAFSGTRSAGGTFNWTARVADANNVVATLVDSSITDNGNVWAMAADLAVSDFVIGTFPASAFTDRTTPPNGPGYLYLDNGIIYNSTFTNVAFSSDGGVSWTNTAVAGTSNSGGRLAFAGGFQFMAPGPSTAMQRRSSGAWAAIGAANQSSCINVKAFGNTLVHNGDNGFTNKRRTAQSLDFGATWTYSSVDIVPTNPALGGMAIGFDTTGILAIAYVDGADGNKLKIKSSSDFGNTASAVLFSSTVAMTGQAREIIFADGHWIIFTDSAGYIAYGPTLSTLVEGNCGINARQAAFGGGRFIAGGLDGALRVTDDFGATWSQSFHTPGANDITGLIWIGP